MDWFSFKDVVPRPAAAGILLSADGSGEVLMGRRNKALQFMGGHHVFPGGGVDKTDPDDRVRGAEDREQARSIFAAAREIFEETGILCARGGDWDDAALHAARRALLAKELPFAGVLERFGAHLEGDDFTFAGEWVTPPFSPIRFRTNYYVYHHHGPRIERVEPEENGEIVALDWLTPREARRRWQRGDIWLSTPVAFVLQHLAALPLVDALPWLRQTPGLDITVPNRFELRRGMGLIPLVTTTLPPATHTNCVIVGEEELYIVDPGADDAAEQAHLVRHIEHLVALGGRVAGILLTHGHPDHTGAVPHLRERYGAPVWAHPETSGRDQLLIDHPLDDGMVIEVAGDPGWRLRCLHTPGHDPGHVVFIEETTRSLIAGDLLANPGTIIISPDYDGDMDAYLASLERIQAEQFSFTLPSHGLPLWGNSGREKLAELTAHRLMREEKIRLALTAGAATMDELLAQAYDDTDRAIWPLAEHQLRAHLKRMKVALPARA